MALFTRFSSGIREYPKMLWLLAFACFLNIAGLSFLWPINSIYMHEVLGKPMTVAGTVLLLHSAGAAVGYLLGGFLFDRIGARPVLLGALFISTVIMALIAVFDSWPLYVTVMILFGFSASLTFPSFNALGARSWPEGGRRAFNFLYVANNVGVAVGVAAGGLVAQYSFQAAFLAASLTMLVLALFVFVFIRDTGSDDAASSEPTPSPVRQADQETAAALSVEPKIPWLPIFALFFGFILVWICYVQWQSSLAVYMKSTGIGLAAYSLIWTVNGLVIFLGQPLLALVMRLFKSLHSQMYLGTALFMVTYALLLTSDSYAMFMTGMIIMTFGEMLLWPGVPAAVAQLSPPSHLGSLQGLIGSGATIGRMFGPLIGGLFYDHLPFHVLLLFMLGLLVVPMLCFALYAKAIRRQAALSE